MYPSLASERGPEASSSNAVPDIANIFDEPTPPPSPNSRIRETLVLSDSEDEEEEEVKQLTEEDDDDIVEIPKPAPPKPVKPLMESMNLPAQAKPRPKDPYKGLAIPKQHQPGATVHAVSNQTQQRQPSNTIQRLMAQPNVPVALGANAAKASWGAAPIPIGVPRNPPPPKRPGQVIEIPDDSDGEAEKLDVPEFRDEINEVISPADADKALRDLMSGAIAEDEVVIDEDDAIVDGFKEGFTLLPHQIQGRHWMKSREDVKAKRFGGILADDMGLGKTIQTLNRITEGRAKKSDRAEGWSGSTLVVVPLSVLNQWVDEARRITTDLRITTHHGPNRTADPKELCRFHIVVTTYDVLKSEFNSFKPEVKDESKKKSKLKSGQKDDSDSETEGFGRTLAKGKPKKILAATMQTKWWRVVLDEAHTIKNRSTKAALACFELQARFKWCLTGTPMQNEVTELFSLLKFLHIKPFCDFERFNSEIAKPVKSGRGVNRAMKKLQVVLKSIMLRRRKDQLIDGKALIELPPRHLEVVSCEFSPVEQAFYDELAAKMDSTLETLMAQEGKKDYISVLLLLLRLRQACDHCVLVSKDFKDDSEAIDPKAVQGSQEAADGDDLVAAFGQLNVVTRQCGLCMVTLTPSNTAKSMNTHCHDCADISGKAQQTGSTKIRKIMEILETIDKESNGEDKTIIFSQFTTMLDLIEPVLIQRGIRWVRFDGKMKAPEREVTLNRIKNDPKTRVILISFKAGSTGLNLTACNRVILVDMWWNPALEDQAFDRSHRYGQKKRVDIYKLKVDGTVEDRILALQEKKRELTKAALSGDKVKNIRLDMTELLALFARGGNDDDDDE